MTSGFIPPHGGYEDLLSYRKALIVFDATKLFCARFLDRRDRTVDQMVQAARSGKQIRQLEQAFLKEGGLRERMTRARLDTRQHGGQPFVRD